MAHIPLIRSFKGSPLPVIQIGILGLLTIFSYGSWFYGFGVLLDDMTPDFESGVGVLTLGYTIAQILTGVLGMVAGRMLDQFGSRVPFAIGALLGPTIVFLASIQSNPSVFSILFGIGSGIIGATSFYHLTQTVAARLAVGNESRAIALLTIWGAFASPILIPVTEVMRQSFGWRNTVRSSAVVVALVLVAAALFVDRDLATKSRAPSASSRLAVAEAWNLPQVRRYAVSSFVSSFGTSIIMVLQIPVMVAGGIERSTAASLAGARGFAQLLGRLPLGHVLSLWPTRNILIGAKILVAVGALLLSISSNLFVAILFVVVGGIGIGAVSPLDGIYAREVLPAQDLGTLMGAMHFFGGFTSGFGPLIGAVIIDVTGRDSSALVFAALMLLIGAVWLLPSKSERVTKATL